ncbi:hypothetical protein EDB89DRAFT_1334484 [Lactarius sanguifluus]|nr:hypothetical protein EDB89DRAFT_1334484 [Lactarius sanguifluus]
MTRKTRRRNKSQGVDLEAQPEDKVGREETHQISTHMSVREGEVSGASGSDTHVEAVGEAQAGSASSQAEAPKRASAPSIFGEIHQPGDDDRTPADNNTVQPMPPDIPRMIGDFDDNANAMWSLHVKEAMNHDDARIQSLKGDMDGVLIFAGFFSIALASFLVDKIHDLQPDPAQQMVYYQQQNVALLAQISQQVSSIAPQVSIPSAPPLPYAFRLNPSDVRVNVFWFMSLVFSISAALLATLVQQWVRNYMHVFQRYSNPLKSARLRQYLYEGAEGWYMPGGGGICAGPCPCFPLLILRGTRRLTLQCEHHRRRHHYRPDYHLRVSLRVQHVCSGHQTAISISKPILWPNMVSEAEGAPATLLGSRVWWLRPGPELEHITRTDATGDGRE